MPPFSLVLSGGGLKGLAHIGALRALEERGLQPSLIVGVSMGSLIAAAWASGRSVRELEDRALALTRPDVFRIAHVDMALKRMLSPAVYRREPLERIIASLVDPGTFRALRAAGCWSAPWISTRDARCSGAFPGLTTPRSPMRLNHASNGFTMSITTFSK